MGGIISYVAVMKTPCQIKIYSSTPVGQ